MQQQAPFRNVGVRTLRNIAVGSLVTSLVVLGITLNAGLSQASPPVSSPKSAPPACSTSTLDVWFDTSGNGAAGTSYYQLNFTNFSGHTCTLKGYPGVSGVNITQHQIGSPANRSSVYPSKVITLTSVSAGAGQGSATSSNTATATIGIVDTGNYSTSTCKPVIAAGLKVYPPNQKASKYVTFPFSACSKAGVQYLTTSTVEKSTF